MKRFPDNFKWGVSTSAYQVEGGAFEDGKGLCNWDTFCMKPGRVRKGATGNVSCDQYHKWPEDLKLLKELGVHIYRFSLNWARILPSGTGEVNEQGIAYYNRVIDGCLANGIEPVITLFHFDYPQALEVRGGWQNPDSPYWFEEYADVVGRYFGDRVKRFITINEPSMYVGCSFDSACFPPAIKLTDDEILPLTHHMLKGHGLAVRKLQSYGCQVGYAPCGDVGVPCTETAEDIEAAKKIYFGCAEQHFYYYASWWSDPILLGKYPNVPELLAKLPTGWEEDLKIISTPIDFYCQNIYGAFLCRSAENEEGCERVPYVDVPLTASKKEVTPEALYWGPKFLYERYKKPILITENGMSGADWVSIDGRVHDPQRIDYLRRYLTQLHRAISEGVDMIGYCHWSFLDNFEWDHAYAERYGMVHVNFETLKRTPKDSYYEYQTIIAENQL